MLTCILNDLPYSGQSWLTGLPNCSLSVARHSPHDPASCTILPMKNSTISPRSWVCYLLRCADDTLYCGITNDLAKRIAAHNAGTAAKYTRARGPVALVYQECCEDRSSASKREVAIKKLSRVAKLALIDVYMAIQDGQDK